MAKIEKTGFSWEWMTIIELIFKSFQVEFLKNLAREIVKMFFKYVVHILRMMAVLLRASDN